MDLQVQMFRCSRGAERCREVQRYRCRGAVMYLGVAVLRYRHGGGEMLSRFWGRCRCSRGSVVVKRWYRDAGANVQVQRGSVVVQRCREIQWWCRGAERCRCRGKEKWTEVQSRCKQDGAEQVQRCRGAKVQMRRCRGAEVQMRRCRGAEMRRCLCAEYHHRCWGSAEVQVQKCRAGAMCRGSVLVVQMIRYGGAEMQRCCRDEDVQVERWRGAEAKKAQRCRASEVQRCSSAVVHRCWGAEVLQWWEVQRCRCSGAEEVQIIYRGGWR
jgi:hypothetical protein